MFTTCGEHATSCGARVLLEALIALPEDVARTSEHRGEIAVGHCNTANWPLRPLAVERLVIRACVEQSGLPTRDRSWCARRCSGIESRAGASRRSAARRSLS